MEFNVETMIDGLKTVENDKEVFFECLDIISGIKCRLAKTMFEIWKNDVVQNGGIWSNPMRIEDIMSAMSNKFRDSSESIVKSRNNYVRYVRELIASNVFHRCGRNNFYVYTFEKNILSWSYYSQYPYLYPESLKTLSSSFSEYSKKYLLNKKHDKHKMPPVHHDFAEFVEKIVNKTNPYVRILLPKFSFEDGYNKATSSCIQYIDDIEFSSQKHHRYERIDDVKINKTIMPKIAMKMGMPAGNKMFYAIDPVNGGDIKAKRKTLFINSNSNLYLDKVNDVTSSNEDLKIAENPIHLFIYFEKKVKEFIGDRTQGSLFLYDSNESNSAKEIFNQLFQDKLLNEDFLSSWIDWYLNKVFKQSSIKNRGKSLGYLLKTWKRYDRVCRMKCIIINDGKRLAIKDLDTIYSNGITYQSLRVSLVKYGVGISYAYLVTFFSKAEAVDNVFSYLSDINEEFNKVEVKAEYFEIIKSTFFHGIPDNSFFLIDDQIKAMLLKINKKMGLTSSSIVKENKDECLGKEELTMFWTSLECANG